MLCHMWELVNAMHTNAMHHDYFLCLTLEYCTSQEQSASKANFT